MQADDFILKLPNTPFKTKESLPKHPGIYYVVDDQTQEILYIGQSVNINSRWLGRGHHREHQLTSLRRSRRTTLTIYHEYVKLELLDITEQQRIQQYSPLLNDSPVKIRKTIPAEQLLVDSLNIFREDILILGLEPPRKEIAKTLESAEGRDNLTKASILELPVVHLLIIPQDCTAFLFKRKLLLESFFKRDKQSKYARQWSRIYRFNSDFICHRFVCNGYVFELTEWWYWYHTLKNKLKHQEFREKATTLETTLAGITLKALSKESFDLLTPDPNQNNNPVRYLLERLTPYQKEIITLSENTSDQQVIKQLNNTQIEEEIKRILSRINKLTTLFSQLRSLIVGEYSEGETRCIVVAVYNNEYTIFENSMKKGKGGWFFEKITYVFEEKEYETRIEKYAVNNYRFEFICFNQIIRYMCLENRL